MVCLQNRKIKLALHTPWRNRA